MGKRKSPSQIKNTARWLEKQRQNNREIANMVAEVHNEVENTKKLQESVEEGVQWVANMMNKGNINPKDVYPKGRYSGD
jgi:thiamine kinase-like enzyme